MTRESGEERPFEDARYNSDLGDETLMEPLAVLLGGLWPITHSRWILC
jgi:hypothetical protein